MRQGRSREYLKGTRRRGKYKLPLDKFLTSRLGRLWDDIYSEITHEFCKGTRARREFESMLDYKMQTNCWIGAETGTIYNSLDREVDGFYVHPHTGILSWTEIEAKPKLPRPITKIPIATDKALERIESIWYYVEYVKNPYYYGGPGPYDSQPYIIGFKRQLSKSELRLNGLRNE